MFRTSFIFFISFISFNVSAGGVDTNWRSLFPDVPAITLTDMATNPAKLALVDVRSKFQFDRKHIEGAHNISLTSPTFVIQMLELQEKNKGKTIVVYCGTGNCIKAYRAIEKCKQNGINNVALYDASIDNNIGDMKAAGSNSNAHATAYKM